jgi:2-iminobutanoate/2-iminopropanoate deaminase
MWAARKNLIPKPNTLRDAMRISYAVVALAACTCIVLTFAQPAVAGRLGSIQFINSGKVLSTNLPFSEAVRVENTIYLSGQIGVVPGSMKIIRGDIRAEATQTMDNSQTTLGVSRLSMRDVVKCTVMLADINEWETFNDIYKTYFIAPYPARSAFATSGLALGARVEVEWIAVVRRK